MKQPLMPDEIARLEPYAASCEQIAPLRQRRQDRKIGDVASAPVRFLAVT